MCNGLFGGPEGPEGKKKEKKKKKGSLVVLRSSPLTARMTNTTELGAVRALFGKREGKGEKGRNGRVETSTSPITECRALKWPIIPHHGKKKKGKREKGGDDRPALPSARR